VVTLKAAFDISKGRLSGCIGDISLDGFYEEESSRYLSNFGLKGLGKLKGDSLYVREIEEKSQICRKSEKQLESRSLTSYLQKCCRR